MVLLERLSDARRNGHEVLAVIAGSAINQDGASNGLTAPNGPSQQRVIRAALAAAGVSAEQVDVVEGHGSGTRLGDPIEAQAVLAAYGQGRPEGRPLWLGSVKSNIGHAQTAAGIAGVIKMVLALQHHTLPRTLHADEPSPEVDWSAGAVRLLAEPVPWPADPGRPRRAGVSSFGFSGTNAHVILQDAPGPLALDTGPVGLASGSGAGEAVPVLSGAAASSAWLVSGRTPAALAAQAARLREWAAAREDLDPADLAWSLAATRTVLEHRAVITGASRDELLAGLAAAAAGQPSPAVITGADAQAAGKTVFVFPGQGAQWAGMGRELAACSPVFAARLAECGRALAPYVDWSLDDVLAGAEGAPEFERADVIQPAMWAVMVSLAAVWEAAGVLPDAVVGHSQGEIAAACVAGILTLDDAARVVALRSRALRALAGRGGMMSVAESAAAVRDRLAPWGDRLSVAAVNGPAATVVSGAPDAIAELAAACADQGVRIRQVPVDYASHSVQVEQIREEILDLLAGLSPREALLPMVSSMSGDILAGPEADAAYWYASLRAPVEFSRAVGVLAGSGHGVFVEVSPHPVLTAAIAETAEEAGRPGAVVTGTLRRDEGGPSRLLASLAEVHVRGVGVDWAAVLPAGRRVELPTYAFQRQRYWPQAGRGAGDVAAAGLGAVDHPLLGAAVELAGDGGGLVLTGRLSRAAQPWLADHAVAGTVLVPGTALVEMAIRAGDAAGCGLVEELTLEAPLVVPAEGTVQVQVLVQSGDEAGRRQMEIHARTGDAPWARRAAGVLAPVASAAAFPGAGEPGAWPPAGAVRADVEGLYAGLAAGGYGYGEAFRGLRAAWRRGDDVFAEVALPEEAAGDAGSFGIHPALLDAALHGMALAADDGVARLPFAYARVVLHAVGASALRVRLSPVAGGWSVAAADATGAPVVSVASLVSRPVTAGQLEAAAGRGMDALFGVEWLPVPASPVADVPAGVRVIQVPSADRPGDAGAAARSVVSEVLDVVQGWLGEERPGSSRLVIVTRGAVAAMPGEGVSDLAGAAVWGLVRSAQSEEPGRITLVDLPASGFDEGRLLATAVACGEPEVAVRGETLFGRRLVRAGGGLVPPGGGIPWRLAAGGGTLDGLAMVPCPEAAAPLAAGQVRVAVRAAGLNFRDVVVALGMIDLSRDPGAGLLGGEIAGVVTETGPGVTGLAAGDRVMGMAGGGFGPVATADTRTLVKIPPDWSFAQAAAVPAVFTTAWYGLVDLARIRRGQRLLVHAAAGGVGMAAVAIARHLGLEVFATASPAKHGVLADLGLDQAHIASSRDAGFGERFAGGVDVVLNSLAGDLTDTGLRLLGPGGVFLEMGKTDLRDPAQVAADHPGVTYRPFNPAEAGAERLGEVLAEVTALLEAGVLAGLPVRCWDVRSAAEAFRFMSQARHTGKIVLTIPPDPAAPRVPGTVLVTGGTGMLGGLVAGHLARTGQARGLVLAGRSGPAAAGVPALAAGLAEACAGVVVAACDTADRAALGALVAGVPAESPLTGVVHAAGVLDDGTIGSLSPARVDAVMRPKADAAWHLHEVTADADLSSFVMFSSAAATFGSGGQGNYAAGNAFLDGLASYRRSAGLPGTSLAWGLWAEASGLTGRLAEGDRARMTRGGISGLSAAEGLALLDAAAGRAEAVLVPARLDLAGLRAAARSGSREVPALLRGLAGGPGRRQAAAAAAGVGGGLGGRLAGLPGPERERVLTDLVRGEAAAVLGHASAEAVEAARAFKDLGFDSLTAVELRNRLNAATGLVLPATLIFDYPSPVVLARYLRVQLLGEEELGPGQERDRDRGEATATVAEPVAIVGMGCRYPGGAVSPEQLWELLASGTDAIGRFPADRGWAERGAAEGLRGGFVTDAAGFDAGFFGISPREALAMDPQQRILLETCWEALEDAGIDPAGLRGSATGVFAGAAGSGYVEALGEGQGSEGYLLTGLATSVVSGRVAYVFGLEGPAVTVDTACSSSLVALHLACGALRSGECDLALAGGVAVMITPGIFAEFSRQGGLAADGRCKAFGAGADGTGWGEGAGVLVVERLSDAVRNGHRVLAVVAGSAVNQDGASNGLTAPNGPSQQRVIRAALASAGLSADQVDAVEAHGTGTVLGDPIEAQALIAAYGQDRDRPLWLGSVKSNIGHAQAAAGAAGVIKMVLALRHGVLPATLHAGEPSPHVDWSAGGVRLLAEPVPWPGGGERPRRAGVSSFGISGTNAHVILEEVPAAQDSRPAEDGGRVPVVSGGPVAWLVSGRGAEGLAGQAARLAAWASAREDLDPGDVAWSLATTRPALEHRAVITGAGREELLAGLAAVAAGEPAGRVVSGAVAPGAGVRVGFLFSGQGSQRAGMGRELHAASPVFAAAFDRACGLLEERLGVPVAEVVLGAGEDDRADQTLYAQAGLFAVQAGLVALLAAAGVTPDAVAGHSVGEVGAAYAAGVLSLEDACTLVAARARVMQALPSGGAMCAVQATEAEVAAALDGVAGVSIAAVNGPSSVVISGDAEAVDEVAERFRGDGRRARRLHVSHAFHSHRMDPVLAELGEVAAGLAHGMPRVPWAGALSGELVAGPGPGYWVAQARGAVRFADAVAVLAAQGVTVFVELGPDGTLSGLGPAALPGGEGVFVPVLRPGRAGAAAVVTALARAHVAGVAVDWAAVLPTGQRVELPTYAFRHQRFWPRAAGAGAGSAVALGVGAAGHPLLGAAVELAGGGGLVLTGRLSLAAQPWLADHMVAGTVLVPGTALVELAVRAGDLTGCGQLAELALEAPLVLDGEAAVQLQVVVGGADDRGQRAVEIYARPEGAAGEGGWTRHASGLLSPAVPEGAAESAAWPPEGAVPVDVDGFYPELAAAGYGYGPAFRGLRAAWRRGEVVFAEVSLPEEAADEAGLFGIHPALLDAALHAVGLAGGSGADESGGALLPWAWQGVVLHAAGASALRVRLSRAADGWSVTAADEAGSPVASVESLVLRPMAAGQLAAAPGRSHDALFAVEWVPVALADHVAVGNAALIGLGGTSAAAALAGAGAEVAAYPDLAGLAGAVGSGVPVPGLVVVCAGAGSAGSGDAGVVARSVVSGVLELVQEWLGEERLGSSRLVIVTRGAVSAVAGEGVPDLAGAAVWGLVRSAQSEEPGRIVLVDLPAGGLGSGSDGAGLLAVAAVCGEPEVAVREGALYGRRLVRAAGGLVPPGGPSPDDRVPWRLEAGGGTLDGLALVPCLEAGAPLAAGQVRVAVRAAGLNFRDVIVALGMIDLSRDPGAGVLGGEIAGVVLEPGPEVSGLAAGDRVMGVSGGGFGPVVVADGRTLVKIPSGWSFAQAAAVPVVFTTAWYGLVDLARVRPGQRLLVHAAAGGVGMAAVAVGRHLGLEVFATASPAKHGVLAAMGLDAGHIASSRDAGFEQRFAGGVDVVLNSLAGELTDAGLRLLGPGGVFLEMGKTDLRDPAQVAADHPGVTYRPFNPDEAGAGRLGEMLREVTGLLEAGVLAGVPVRCWDVRQAGEAFRFMSQARHTGKIVLTIPPDPAAPREPGTVLVAGGTGMLGGLVAGHLAATGRARQLVLAGRSGPAASGVPELAAALASAGAEVLVAACDTADRAALGGLVAGIPASRPLTGVVHAAGVLDDGIIGSLSPGRVDAVMRPKADAAWHLHEVTRNSDLSSFVMFSSAAATFGSPGQGNYAAGNAFLDGLASYRRSAGLPGVSLAWGLWAEASGITGHLGEGDRTRIGRGMAALSAGEGLALLDAAAGRAEAVLVPARLDIGALRAAARSGAGGSGEVPALMRGLARQAGAPSGDRGCGNELGRRAGRAAGRTAGPGTGADADQPGPGGGRGGTRARLGRGGGGGPGVQGPGVRLADRGGAAEPAQRRDRAGPARHLGVRLPCPGRAGPLPAGSATGRPGPGTRPGARRGPRAGGGGGAGGDRGHGLPVSRRGRQSRTAVAAARLRYQRGGRGSGGPRLGL